MKFLQKLQKRGGFTLAEMLIVMAVVVVLAAATMPAVADQIESARESIDVDNLRAAYSEAYTQAYMDFYNTGAFKTTGYVIPFTPVQTKAGWQGSAPKIGGGTVSEKSGTTTITANQVTFTFIAADSSDASKGIKLADTTPVELSIATA